jgi:osmoprotectant transport system ATP-binding protein
MSTVEFRNIFKSYDRENLIIDDLNLFVDKGEFITILGPSGCGKTTLLKMVNKLLIPDKGEIYVDDEALSSIDKIELRRSVGYVIQQIGLFPHLTIMDNIGFVLSLENVPKEVKAKRAKELLLLVGLEESLLERYPRELSGGQKQRVGVARALAADPKIILMDEPFGAVDEIARKRLQDKIIELHQQLGKTILFVTHDIEEALKLGTRVILMNNGIIEQIGTSKELIFNPKNDFVKEFLGLKGFKSIIEDKELRIMYKKELEEYNLSES